MKILGIDTGINIIGWVILEKNNNKLCFIHYKNTIID